METFMITLDDSSKHTIKASDIAMALTVWRHLNPSTLDEIAAIERV